MNNRNYYIKEGYTINSNPEYFVDIANTLTYQPDVYELALFLAQRSKSKYIVDIGGGNGDKLKKFRDFKIIAVDYGDNIELLKKQSHIYEVIEHDLENGFPSIPLEIISNAVVIFSDVVEHLLNPHLVLEGLSKISFECDFLIISTPDRTKARGVGDNGPPRNTAHVREWNIEEFDTLLKAYKFNDFLIGHTVNTNVHLWKNTIISISGKFAYCKDVDKVKVLAILNVFNEEDIISETINHLLRQELDVKVIDNWSTDSTYEILKKISDSDERVTVERYPEKSGMYYEWESLLKNTEKLSISLNYDWYVHYDADEIRESPWRGFNLCQAISFVDYCGFNAIDFTVLDFRPINNDTDSNYEENLKFFEFGKRNGHFKQIKCWKKTDVVNLSATGGHEAQFTNSRVFPIKFLTKHYPLRNTHQARKKIFTERINRISPNEKKMGWHTHYNHHELGESFIWEIENLLPWNPNVFESEYLVERISGIGIRR
ncbi:hypothetical protein HNR77_005802 [Paenibacillus sp. JGP012]|uniref:glycosyltransferase n=1 Tax=Paenibacillus sp. JGP012 TaxID=2735914 RepID=UPI00161D9838|nr:glycosyltransferase [Paenibacillus sp. JGP012]MBB6024667.1 hypothetical protein [Paenibacillus sp. JGP012]